MNAQQSIHVGIGMLVALATIGICKEMGLHTLYVGPVVVGVFLIVKGMLIKG